MLIVNELKTNNQKDYVLVAMLEPQKVGHRFSEWPLHITVIPWFSAPNIEVVERLCTEVVADVAPFSVQVLERAYFGSRKLPVKLIEKHPKLLGVHNNLLTAVQRNNWELQGRYTGPHYKPHVTKHVGKDAKDEVVIDAIYIVERLEQGYRRIAGKVLLHG